MFRITQAWCTRLCKQANWFSGHKRVRLDVQEERDELDCNRYMPPLKSPFMTIWQIIPGQILPLPELFFFGADKVRIVNIVLSSHFDEFFNSKKILDYL